MKIKRTCNGCRASEFHNECSLGYACKEYTPLELCPKPKTIIQLINAPKSLTHEQNNKTTTKKRAIT